jgi:hypothetical protein
MLSGLVDQGINDLVTQLPKPAARVPDIAGISTNQLCLYRRFGARRTAYTASAKDQFPKIPALAFEVEALVPNRSSLLDRAVPTCLALLVVH